MGTISRTGITNGNTIQPSHITGIIDALDGTSTTTTVKATGSFSGSFKGDFEATADMGIGTSSPTAKLHIVQTSADDALRVDDVSSDTTPFIINNAGDVGVGTESPDTKLTISASGADGINIGPDGDFSKQSARLFFSNDTAGQAVAMMNVSGTMQFRTAATAGVSSGTARMFLSASNVGIGISTPSASVHIVQSAAANAFRVDDASSDTTPLIIDQNGNLAIGKTSASGKLDVNGAVIFTGSLSQGLSTITSGSYSHAEGSGADAVSSYSHAEGFQSKTGVTTAFSASVSGSTLTLQSTFGNVTSSYIIDDFVLIDWGSTGLSARRVTSASYDGTSTKVFIAGGAFGAAQTQSSIVPAYNNQDTWTGINVINTGLYAHAEGKRGLALGNYAHGEGSASIAAGVASHAEGNSSIAIGDFSHAEGVRTSAEGTGASSRGYGTTASGSYSHAAGYITVANGQSSYAGGLYNTASADYTHVFGGRNIAMGIYQVAMGVYCVPATGAQTASHYAPLLVGNGTGYGATSNAFRVSGSGNVYAGGSFTNGGADYAEYFESVTGTAIALGTVVELDNGKIKTCTNADNAIGVISSNPTMLGNSDGGTADEWVGKYEKDVWGNYVFEEYTYEETAGINEDTGEPNIVIKTGSRRKISTSYDPNLTYIPRDQRPEWNVVGLLGQIRVLKNQQIPTRWIKIKDINNDIAIYLVR